MDKIKAGISDTILLEHTLHDLIDRALEAQLKGGRGGLSAFSDQAGSFDQYLHPCETETAGGK